MKKLFVLAALLVLPACESSTDSNFVFQFQSNRLDQVPNPPIVTSAEVEGPGLISVAGGEVTPCFLDRIILDGDKNGRTLTIIVRREASNPCDSTVRHHSWIAIFSALVPGQYHLRVVNRVDGGAGTVEYETDLTVN
ncbi:MAG TPA: hypothetical protein VFX98_04800 [Longimicrobiaceae bacterium]|nr:hypothetical protein [Longimicrobiaceae bacterium]